VFIDFQIEPDSYKGISYKSSDFHFSKYSRWKITDAGDDKDVYALGKISKMSLYINFLKLNAVLILIFLSVKEFQKVMKSVKSLKTFEKNNVISFRRIGKYLLFIFLLTSYIRVEFQQGGFSGIHISFTPLFLMLIAFIMAEIFKEGNLLKQENDLTI
jgi:hypothetical protein